MDQYGQVIERRHTDEEILEIVKKVQNGRGRIGLWQWTITTLPVLLVVIGTAVTGGLELGTIQTKVQQLENFRDKGERYTAAQGAAIAERVKNLEETRRHLIKMEAESAATSVRVAKLEKWTEAAPPSWFRSEVSRLAQKVTKMEASITDLAVEVRYMERRRRESLKEQ